MKQGGGDEIQTEGCGDGGEVQGDGFQPVRERGGRTGGGSGKL